MGVLQVGIEKYSDSLYRPSRAVFTHGPCV